MNAGPLPLPVFGSPIQKILSGQVWYNCRFPLKGFAIVIPSFKPSCFSMHPRIHVVYPPLIAYATGCASPRVLSVVAAVISTMIVEPSHRPVVDERNW